MPASGDLRSAVSSSRHRRFVPPAASTRENSVGVNWSYVMSLVEEMIGQYHLNTDQSESLKQCAEMFNPETNRPPLVLIHGEVCVV